MAESEILKALKEQLLFFENGGYGHSYRSAWRPTLLLRDSPLCLNAIFTKARPCRECVISALIPADKKNSLLPCHHIPLNEAGDTIAGLYNTGTPERLDRAFHEWLCATIQRLAEKEATHMKTLESTTAISFKNILFLNDFTEASEAACAYAMAFGYKHGARVYPAHVVEPVLAGEMEAPLTPEIMKNIENQKRRDLACPFIDSGLNYETLVAEGSVENILPQWTAQHGIDLIVIGTHGRKGVDRFLLGSTAEIIFRMASCPVLTVGPNVEPWPGSEFEIKKILFATSLTKEAEPALTYALSFAHDTGTVLTVLHVVPGRIARDPDPRVAVESARGKLTDLVPLGADLAHRPEFLISQGDPSKQILEYATRERVDLIVLGLSKETKTSTHFQRGIAYKIISSAPCAVLTVR
jgi:nucleotide-binding universal stress UspA family protein